MERVYVALLTVLIAVVAVHAVLTWRAAERESCLQRAEALATIALLASDGQVEEGAVGALAEQVDDC
jgi:hypothetical protein